MLFLTMHLNHVLNFYKRVTGSWGNKKKKTEFHQEEINFTNHTEEPLSKMCMHGVCVCAIKLQSMRMNVREEGGDNYNRLK